MVRVTTACGAVLNITVFGRLRTPALELQQSLGPTRRWSHIHDEGVPDPILRVTED